MIEKVTNAVVAAVLLLAFFSTASAQEPNYTDERLSKLIEAAESMEVGLAGIPIQWFEMQSAVGWEKMMLIFGYADNLTTCSQMVIIAKQSNADRDFRCVPAN